MIAIGIPQVHGAFHVHLRHPPGRVHGGGGGRNIYSSLSSVWWAGCRGDGEERRVTCVQVGVTRSVTGRCVEASSQGAKGLGTGPPLLVSTLAIRLQFLPLLNLVIDFSNYVLGMAVR